MCIYSDTELDLHRLWEASMEHLQRVWHVSSNAYPSGHLVPSPIVGLACAQIVENLPCLYLTFTSNTPWYFLDFEYKISACLKQEIFVYFLNFIHRELLWYVCTANQTCVLSLKVALLLLSNFTLPKHASSKSQSI